MRTDKKVYDIWLDGIMGLSPRQKTKLVRRFKSSREIFEAGASQVCFACTGKSLKEHPKGPLWIQMFSGDLKAAEAQLKNMEKKGIGAVSRDEEEYPETLQFLSDAPWMLYYKGKTETWRKPGIAVVGARNCTEYGRWAAFELGKRLSAAGAAVISGMARGVDSAAHRGALEGEKDLCTVAVFGCGVDVCYPKTNGTLMEKIEERGILVSELPPGTQPRPFFFPRRNRIISGLSQGVAVMEAGLRSGSLITAELAAEQGKDVYALPGNIDREASIGTNKLIQDGAIPIVTLDDVVIGTGMFPESMTVKEATEMGKDEQKLYSEVLRQGEINLDRLALAAGFSVEKTGAVVTVMEMKGILQTSLGKIFIAKK